MENDVLVGVNFDGGVFELGPLDLEKMEFEYTNSYGRNYRFRFVRAASTSFSKI